MAIVGGLILTLRKRRQGSQADTTLMYLTCTGAWIGLTGVVAAAAGMKLNGLEAFNLEAGGLAALAR
jgi:hypothetical protein